MLSIATSIEYTNRPIHTAINRHNDTRREWPFAWAIAAAFLLDCKFRSIELIKCRIQRFRASIIITVGSVNGDDWGGAIDNNKRCKKIIDFPSKHPVFTICHQYNVVLNEWISELIVWLTQPKIVLATYTRVSCPQEFNNWQARLLYEFPSPTMKLKRDL